MATAGNAPFGQQGGDQPRMATPTQGQPGLGGTPTQGMASPNKEVNMATLCRMGQETVQEIVTKTNEVFSVLKTMQVVFCLLKPQNFS